MTELYPTVVTARVQAVREARNLAVRLLTRREHAELEIRNKLLRRGFNEDIVSALLIELCGNDLLSNERFTEAYVGVRKERGYGPLKIQAELRERGVADSLIKSALNASDEFWTQHAERALAKRFRKRPVIEGNQTTQTSMRVRNESAQKARFLSSRGFPSAIIYRSLGAQNV